MDDETFAWCLFCEADADGSGGLDRDEVKTLARQLGYPLSAVELDEAMAEMDTDGGGSVEFDEFLAWFRRIQDAGGKTSWAKQLAVGTTQSARLRYIWATVVTPRGGFAGRPLLSLATLRSVITGRGERIHDERNAGP
eukprot:COSAG02_NODE_8825_length_2430_cov_6.219059_2_plen_138_part_00